MLDTRDKAKADTIARARVALFKLMPAELTGDEFARMEMDIADWINSARERINAFWIQPELTIRRALRALALVAFAETGTKIGQA
jgi:hypothetical protein